MGSQIEEITAAGVATFFPHLEPGLGTPAVEGGLKIDNSAECLFTQKLTKRLEVTVPATVMEGDEVTLLGGGEFDQAANLV